MKTTETIQEKNSLTSIILKAIYYCSIYPILFIFGGRVSGRFILDDMMMLFTGMNLTNGKKIRWSDLDAKTQFKIVAYSIAIILLQVFLIWVFVKFSFVEALFWKALIEKESQLFYFAASSLLLFKLLDVAGNGFLKSLKGNLIIAWRENYVKKLKDIVLDLLKSRVLQRNTVWQESNFEEWAKKWAPMAESNVNQMFQTAVNIIFNSLNALMMTVYFGHLLVLLSWQIFFWSLGIALGLKLILDCVNKWVNDDVYSQYNRTAIDLRTAGQSLLSQAPVTFSLGIEDKFVRKFDQANDSYSASARGMVRFKVLLNAIRWGLREIIEPLAHVMIAIFYFTGQVSFVRLNLIANAAIKLIYTLLDLGCDIERYNAFDMAFNEVKSKSEELPVPAQLSKIDLSTKSFFDSIGKKKVELEQDFRKGLTRLKGANGAGKTNFYRHLLHNQDLSGHYLSGASSKSIDLESMFDLTFEEKDFTCFGVEKEKLGGAAGQASDGQKAWRHLLSYAVLVQRGEIRKPGLLIFDELDSAIDSGDKQSFMQLCQKVVKVLGVDYAIVTTHASDEFDIPSVELKSGPPN